MNLEFRITRRADIPAPTGAMKQFRQPRRISLVAGLIVSIAAALMTVGCGSSSKTTTTPAGNGTLYTFVSDTPSCNLLSLGVFLTELDLHKVGAPSGTNVTVWPTNSSPTSPVVEMSTLRDTMTIVNVTTVAAATYDQVILKAVVNTAAVYNPTQSPPVSTLVPTVSTSNVTINLSPPLTITAGKVSGLLLDLNLPQSVTLSTDSSGKVTGNVNWQFSSRALTPSGTTGFGEMDALYGFVRSINNSSPGGNFTSSFLLQTLSETSTGQGPALSVDLTKDTQLIGVSRIDQMPTGSYVEVDAYVDSNGNLVANAIQVEDRESLANKKLAYLGPVLDVTKDSNGNITQFDMLVRETQPTDPTEVANNSTVTVYVSSSTTFNQFLLSSDLANMASSGSLAIDDTNLWPGQEVVVSGVFTKPSSGPVTVAADSIYPRMQAVQGTFAGLVGAPGSDNKTGAFNMIPCNGLLAGTPFMVVTDAQSSFENTSGLNTLSQVSPLLARGLTFFSINGTTIGATGTTVPAGTMVLLAKQVRQF